MQRLSWRPTEHRGTLYVRPSRRILGAEFGRDELRHVLFAGLALTLIFAGAYAMNLTRGFLAIFPSVFALFLPFALTATFPPFLLALVMQKRIAEKEGCTTEFRILPQWLLVSVLFAFLFGFVFAAPGTTTRFGNVTRTGVARMSAAVPLAYLAVGGAGLIGGIAVGTSLGWVPYLLFIMMAHINATLAAFSMVPVPGFPGADIWRSSKPFFAALIVAAAGLFLAAAVAVPFFL